MVGPWVSVCPVGGGVGSEVGGGVSGLVVGGVVSGVVGGRVGGIELSNAMREGQNHDVEVAVPNAAIIGQLVQPAVQRLPQEAVALRKACHGAGQGGI